MIIKMQEVTSASLAKLLAFIESDGNKLPAAYADKRVFSVKSVNPGSELGMYNVDLDMVDDYSNGEYNSRRRTSAEYLVHAYEILIGYTG